MSKLTVFTLKWFVYFYNFLLLLVEHSGGNRSIILYLNATFTNLTYSITNRCTRKMTSWIYQKYVVGPKRLQRLFVNCRMEWLRLCVFLYLYFINFIIYYSGLLIYHVVHTLYGQFSLMVTKTLRYIYITCTLHIEVISE